jgi:hypothetical protein
MRYLIFILFLHKVHKINKKWGRRTYLLVRPFGSPMSVDHPPPRTNVLRFPCLISETTDRISIELYIKIYEVNLSVK